jgi:membrane-associated phospholipid phosphatase
MMKALGFIKSVDMEDRQDRIIPFIATMTFYIWAYLVVKNYFDFMLPIYSIFILGTVVSVMLSFFINLFLKLSIHMVGMAGLMAGTLLMMMNSEKSLIGVFLVIIVLTGLVASARLYLKAHTPKEVFIGFLIGISGQMLAFSIFNKFVNQIG